MWCDISQTNSVPTLPLGISNRLRFQGTASSHIHFVNFEGEGCSINVPPSKLGALSVVKRGRSLTVFRGELLVNTLGSSKTSINFRSRLSFCLEDATHDDVIIDAECSRYTFLSG